MTIQPLLTEDEKDIRTKAGLVDLLKRCLADPQAQLLQDFKSAVIEAKAKEISLDFLLNPNSDLTPISSTLNKIRYSNMSYRPLRLIHLAIYAQNLEIVKLLVEHGSKVERMAYDGCSIMDATKIEEHGTLLHYTICSGLDRYEDSPKRILDILIYLTQECGLSLSSLDDGQSLSSGFSNILHVFVNEVINFRRKRGNSGINEFSPIFNFLLDLNLRIVDINNYDCSSFFNSIPLELLKKSREFGDVIIVPILKNESKDNLKRRMILVAVDEYVSEGYLKVREVIKNGFFLDFETAIYNGDIYLLRHLIKAGHYEHTLSNGVPILIKLADFKCSSSDNESNKYEFYCDILNALLENRHIDINSCCPDGKTALDYIMENKNIFDSAKQVMIGSLLSRGAVCKNINKFDSPYDLNDKKKLPLPIRLMDTSAYLGLNNQKFANQLQNRAITMLFLAKRKINNKPEINNKPVFPAKIQRLILTMLG